MVRRGATPSTALEFKPEYDDAVKFLASRVGVLDKLDPTIDVEEPTKKQLIGQLNRCNPTHTYIHAHTHSHTQITLYDFFVCV
jgi:hypothetical protein